MMKYLSEEIWHIPEAIVRMWASSIDSEVKQIIDECYQKAKQVIEDHRQVLNSCAELLLEKEKIGREESEELFE